MRVSVFIVLLIGFGLIATDGEAKQKGEHRSVADLPYRKMMATHYRNIIIPKSAKFSDECGLPQDGAGGYVYVDGRTTPQTANYRLGPATTYRALFSGQPVTVAEVMTYYKGWFLQFDYDENYFGWVHQSNVVLSPLVTKKARACLGIPMDFPQAQ